MSSLNDALVLDEFQIGPPPTPPPPNKKCDLFAGTLWTCPLPKKGFDVFIGHLLDM